MDAAGMLVVSDEPISREAMVGVLAAAVPLPVTGYGTVDDAVGSGLAGASVTLVTAALLDGGTRSAVSRLRPATKALIVVGGAPDPGRALSALDGGANGYLSRQADGAELVAGVKAVMAGAIHVEDRLNRAIVSQMLRGTVGDGPILTPREKQVAGLLASGKTTHQIGTTLFISATTAKSHLSAIYAKLGVNNRAGAIARLAQLGMLADLMV